MSSQPGQKKRDLLDAYNNTEHSTTQFAPNDIKKEDYDTVRRNIYERGRKKNYEPAIRSWYCDCI